jgi:hypothetical protein
MIRKNEILLSRRLGRTIISFRGNKGRRGTHHPFSETILKENHLLKNT